MTKSERQAMSIGKQLVKALRRLEEDFEDDPTMVLDEADIAANRATEGTKQVLKVIRNYYEGNEGTNPE